MQVRLNDFECRFLERKAWCIIFDVSFYLEADIFLVSMDMQRDLSNLGGLNKLTKLIIKIRKCFNTDVARHALTFRHR